MLEILPHQITLDMQKAISETAELEKLWGKITPLAKNEWICWVTSAKQEKTRTKRIKWMTDVLPRGQKRPCCWPGCPHRIKNPS
jgi:uncharacterized protein YdeI (YjbR/CyaY-like superfamily)